MTEPFTISLQIPDNLCSRRLTLAAMKRPVLAVVCVVASFITDAGEPPPAKARGAANQPIEAELQLLQGTWEGAVVGDTSRTKITVTVNGSSFHFHRDTNFWFATTIQLAADKVPKQLHATIKGCPPSQESSIGQVVGAIFKIEDGTLTLATGGANADDTGVPKSFDDTGDTGLTRYELRKVQAQDKNAQPPQTK